MSTSSIPLFRAMTAKMDYLNQRQRIISQNVANADTPGYIPHDLTKVDFGAILKKTTGSNVVLPEVTNPMHMGGVNGIDDPENRKARTTYEVAPDGNSVIMEEQMVKGAKTQVDYSLMTSLYQKNLGMLRTAIGR